MQTRDITNRGSLVSGHDIQIIEERNSTNGNIVKRYSKGRFLGKGGFAKCYQFTSLQTNKKYAAKVIEKASLTRSKAKQKLQSEIKIHKSLKSPYVVGFEHCFEDSQNVYILLELCTNQTLNELIKRRKRITEVQAKCYTYQIINALKDIHDQKVIHRDLKLGNLFLTEKLQIRIGDFGLAAKLNYDGQKRKTMCGTPNYIAPQILQNNAGHSYEVDIWSLGVITYAFVAGRPPFQTNDVKATYNKIKNCNYSFPETVSISKMTKNFIAKMLHRDPARRSTLNELLDDQFFQSSFPKSLPMSTLACPPNAQFLKQFKTNQIDKQSKSRSNDSEGFQTERRGISMGKRQKQSITTMDRAQSTGKVLTRASSIDRMDNKNYGVQRAVSTAALMAGRRLIRPESTHKLPSNQPLTNVKHPMMWVIYSQENPKFGVCYLLNSGACGMRFNDATCIIASADFKKVRYIDTTSGESSKENEVYSIGETPQKLAKKMKILVHYQRELQNRKKQEQKLLSNDERIVRERLKHRETSQTAMTYFVTKYYKTSKVNIFWYNNKDYQVIFKDYTELIVAQNSNVTYVNKVGQRRYFQSNELESQTDQIKKRMNYVTNAIDRIKAGNASKVKNSQETENQPVNTQAQTVMTRSSSVTKLQRNFDRPAMREVLMKGSASTTRLVGYKRKF